MQPSCDHLVIRLAVIADLGAITEIYNHAVQHGVATFDHGPRTIADQYAWLNNRSDRFPVFVAELAGKVVGWAALQPFSHRDGYYATAETSCYVQPEYQGRKLGTRLTETLVAAAKERGFHALIGLVEETNTISIQIGQKMGFEVVGRLPQVGHKFGRWLDVAVMHRILDSR